MSASCPVCGHPDPEVRAYDPDTGTYMEEADRPRHPRAGTPAR